MLNGSFAVDQYVELRADSAIERVAKDEDLEARDRIGEIEVRGRLASFQHQGRMPVDGLGEIPANAIGLPTMFVSCTVLPHDCRGRSREEAAHGDPAVVASKAW